MCGEIQPVRADKVLGCTHFDGLRLIQRADDDWRLAEEVHGVWQSKEHDSGDVIGHLAYSVGFSARQPVQDALAALPKQAWRAALDPDGRPREGAQVAELTRWMPATLTGWPPGMRIIARRERPHPGAPLHITDDDGCASRYLPPAPPAGGSPSWRFATGCGHALRTASADSRTPG